MNILRYIKKSLVFALAVFCLTFALQNPSYAATISGSWQLSSLGGESLLPGTKITATFEDSNTYGNAGCNQYFTAYSQSEPSNIQFRPVGSTRMYCPTPGVMEQEFKYIRALESATSYEVTDTKLKLNYDENKSLEYIKAQ
jgi:heat shock protein HslJ